MSGIVQYIRQTGRDAAWLTAARTRAYMLVLALGLGIGLAHGWATLLLTHVLPVLPASLDPEGKPAPTDFLAFWSAARLALHGMAPAAYSTDGIFPVESAAAFMLPNSYLGFFYPPVFLLLCLPVGLLPYPMALLGFVAVTFALLALLLRRLFPALPAIGLLAFPATMMNAATGQNGFLTAACVAGGALWLEARPILAGVCLGALACKPHLALCVPVALCAARRWRAAAAAAMTAAGLALLSWAVFGGAAWQAFRHVAPLARQALEQDRNDWAKLFSLFSAIRLLHLGLPAAYLAQCAAAMAAMALIALVAWRRPGGRPEMAMLGAAALVCVPHVLDYDLELLLIPAGWLAAEAVSGWCPWEKSVLALLYAAALLGRSAGIQAGVPLGPVAVLALCAVVARRALAARPA